ncbi:hypothetical protein CBR_g12839 [Chara braunii]|uniref:Uncharacterized protein n=1 Tax=Chara braunii TaxID=69332 RepID=A0A388KSY9_CHABU|nr:hypothetical protein CBR_g12839 [Chara braunii]|eukprot:GBG73122.1 hypothetical protein CBR_g12839 [Chara braunii]
MRATRSGTTTSGSKSGWGKEGGRDREGGIRYRGRDGGWGRRGRDGGWGRSGGRGRPQIRDGAMGANLEGNRDGGEEIQRGKRGARSDDIGMKGKGRGSASRSRWGMGATRLGCGKPASRSGWRGSGEEIQIRKPASRSGWGRSGGRGRPQIRDGAMGANLEGNRDGGEEIRIGKRGAGSDDIGMKGKGGGLASRSRWGMGATRSGPLEDRYHYDDNNIMNAANNIADDDINTDSKNKDYLTAVAPIDALNSNGSNNNDVGNNGKNNNNNCNNNSNDNSDNNIGNNVNNNNNNNNNNNGINNNKNDNGADGDHRQDDGDDRIHVIQDAADIDLDGVSLYGRNSIVPILWDRGGRVAGCGRGPDLRPFNVFNKENNINDNKNDTNREAVSSIGDGRVTRKIGWIGKREGGVWARRAGKWREGVG